MVSLLAVANRSEAKTTAPVAQAGNDQLELCDDKTGEQVAGDPLSARHLAKQLSSAQLKRSKTGLLIAG